jgi:hypothetical protein
MDAKTKEEIELLQELIDSPDTPQDEKELYRDTIKELKAEAEKSKPEPKVEKTKTEKKPATTKPSATKKEAPKKLPVDADKMKAEIKERTGKTEEECEVIIAEYRQLREKSKKIEAKRLGKLDDEGKLIAGTKEKTAAAVIETAAENIKDKLEKQVDKLEKEAEKGNPTQDQIESRINKNLGQLSKEMTKQATSFIKGIQSELAKADKTEAKQFLMNVRAEIDDLLSKFGGGGGVGEVHVDLFEDYKNIPSNIREILDRYSEDFEDGNYDGLAKALKEVEKKGYTFEYYLDGQAFALRPKNVKLNQIKGYEEHEDVDKMSDSEIEEKYSEVLSAQILAGDVDEDEVEELSIKEKRNFLKEFDKDTFAEGGWLNDRRQVNQREDYEVRYEKNKNTGRTNYAKKKNSVGSTFGGGGDVPLNTEIILTENRENGAVTRAVVKPFMLESIEDNQYKGGFKRYEIDIYDEVEREPTKKEIEELNSFFDKVGGRFDIGGFVQTYNITQGNMSSSSVNPSQFAVGGSVEDQISYADRRMENLRELRNVSSGEMRENIDFQIEAIEKQKSRLLSGDLVPRKRLFGLF